jgi:multiple sugar transport system substrate-binding protein/raffinose/stachyose/melibiose transport system substrate-binding protein
MKKHFFITLVMIMALSLIIVACQADTPTPVAEEPAAPVAEEPVAPVATEAPAAPAATEPPAAVEKTKANIVHYYSGDMGLKDMSTIIDGFNAQSETCEIVDNTTGHEDFKTQILVMLAGDNPPDVFSYWAGARVQFVVDSNALMELSDFWDAEGLDNIITPGVQASSEYNGGKYSIPQNFHYVGYFYNPKVMEASGVTEMPRTWDEFMAACEKIKAAGYYPIALGSKDRWPGQFYIDFLVSYTAGHEYRAKLQAGEASFTDPEVVQAMELWKELIDKGYFYPDANAYTYTDAADWVANGEAAMTLMGTWVTGYWDGNGLVAGVDYDVFPFPVIDSAIPESTFASTDSWCVPVDAVAPDCAKDFIAWALKPENQLLWAVGQGALPASAQTDTSTFNPVMTKALDYIKGGTMWLPAYDLSTTPPNAEIGLNLVAQMMDDPSQYMTYLEDAQALSAEVFK